MEKYFLVGNKVYLREIKKSDLNKSYQHWFNDEQVCQFNSHHRFPNYRQDMEKYYRDVIQNRDNIVLAIVDRRTESHVGNISLQDIDLINRNAELAIIIGEKKFWGKGLGKEATILMVRHGFSVLNLHRIYCGTSEENMGMRKIAEQCGFKEEGVSCDAIYKNGRYHNIINYGFINKGYEG